MPSLNDQGMLQVMPGFQLSDYFAVGFKGKQNKIKKVTLASNPMRISFRGKQMVFCRFNYFKKIKRNHLEKVQRLQERLALNGKGEVAEVPESFKVAKTVLH